MRLPFSETIVIRDYARSSTIEQWYQTVTSEGLKEDFRTKVKYAVNDYKKKINFKTAIGETFFEGTFREHSSVISLADASHIVRSIEHIQFSEKHEKIKDRANFNIGTNLSVNDIFKIELETLNTKAGRNLAKQLIRKEVSISIVPELTFKFNIDEMYIREIDIISFNVIKSII